MSKYDWKPGDVARWEYKGATSLAMVTETCPSITHDEGLHWHLPDGGWNPLHGDSAYHPLVVLDPEDTEQVERLTKALVQAAHDHCNFVVSDQGIHPETTANALRSLIRPPKPAEPTGLGAVVEGADGRLWVRAERVALGYMHWRSVVDDGRPACAKWAGIDAVRVLSEGVEVDR